MARLSTELQRFFFEEERPLQVTLDDLLSLAEDDGAISLGGLVVCLMGAILSTSILLALFFGGSSLLDLLKTSLGR